jgi:hypothetical protein
MTYLNMRRSSPPCEVNPAAIESFRHAISQRAEMIAAQQKSRADEARLLFSVA